MLPIVRRVEERGGVDKRHVVRIQEDDFAKAAVKDRIGLEFPPAQPPRRPREPHFLGVDARHVQIGGHFPHPLVQLALAQMPELDGQSATEVAEHRAQTQAAGKYSRRPRR